MQYQIGDFSKITRLSIKTLRYYHECNLLVPARVDKESGYRYYDEKCIEKAKIIIALKDLDFNLKEIKSILESCSDDCDMLSFIKKKHSEIQSKLKKYEAADMKLKSLVKQMDGINVPYKNKAIEKDVNDILAASIRFKGRYDDIGKYASMLYKNCKGHIKGRYFCLYHDECYKEKDADIEVCLEVSKEINTGDVKTRALKGGRVISIIHKGPYDKVGDAYKKVLDYIGKNKLKALNPSREIYIKGPGMIFNGNPKNYITELQIMVDEDRKGEIYCET